MMNANDENPSEREIEITQRASLWWALRHDPETWTEADETAFAQWLSADPDHAQAYNLAGVTWTQAAVIVPPHAKARVTDARARGRRHSRIRTALMLGTALAAAACVVVLVYVAGMDRGHDKLPEPIIAISDEHMEQVVLPDGSRVELNRNTRIRFEQTRDMRMVFLERGEALFTVAKQNALPFIVDVGTVQVRVVGTVFNVRQSPGKVIVAVQKGEVALQDPLHSGATMARLRAGHAASVEQASGCLQLRSISVNSIAAWRNGQLRFRGTRLDDAVDELSVYLPGITVYVNPDVGGLLVTGYASVSDPAAFIDALPSLLPVQVIRDQHGNISLISTDQGSLSRGKPLS